MKVDLQELNDALETDNGLANLNSDSDDTSGQNPFEGPEKLLEIWFAPCYTSLKCDELEEPERCGLRAVPESIWEDMLEIVKCKVLSVVHGKEIDAYLLR